MAGLLISQFLISYGLFSLAKGVRDFNQSKNAWRHTLTRGDNIGCCITRPPMINYQTLKSKISATFPFLPLLRAHQVRGFDGEPPYMTMNERTASARISSFVISQVDTSNYVVDGSI